MRRFVGNVGSRALIATSLALAVACGGEEALDGSVDMDGGRRMEGGTFDPDAGREPPPTTCEDFEFLASGRGACNEGCSLSCDCPEGLPISIDSCQPDGCLVAANCSVACDEGLSAALGCVTTYKVPE